MKQATVRDIYNWIDQTAPFETALEYDNAGLLLGSMDAPVARVLVALDATPSVLEEAGALGAQLLLVHHPLMFRGVKSILDDSYEGGIICDAIRRGVSLIAAHTNLDQTPLSGSAALARALGLHNIRQEGFLFVGDLPGEGLDARALRQSIQAVQGEYVCMYGEGSARVRTLAISGGAYDEGFAQAKALGAQAYLTGEVRHHNALAAIGSGLVLFGGGHAGTEQPLVPVLANALQSAMNALQYNVAVFPSKCRPYGGQEDM